MKARPNYLFTTIILVAIILYGMQGFSQMNKDYSITHGKEISGFVAPYLIGYCMNENLNCDSLVKLLFKDSLMTVQHHSYLPCMISSERHINGKWTYFKSRTPLIYEIQKVGSDRYIVLYSKLNPELILTNEKSEWRLALVDNNLNLLDDKVFITEWKYDNKSVAMWDMIYTTLKVLDAGFAAIITYVHSGGGGGRDQEFTANFKINKTIENLNVFQSKDDYY